MSESDDKLFVGRVKTTGQTGGWRPAEHFVLPLANLGDQAASILIEGSEPEEVCRFAIQTPGVPGHQALPFEVTLQPGQTGLVSVIISARRPYLFGLRHKLHLCLVSITRPGRLETRQTVLLRFKQRPLAGLYIFIPLALTLLYWSISFLLPILPNESAGISSETVMIDLPVHYHLVQESIPQVATENIADSLSRGRAGEPLFAIKNRGLMSDQNADVKDEEFNLTEPAKLEVGAALEVPTIPTHCPKPDLVIGQYISGSGSYTETQTTAAGSMSCQLERNSCGYHNLVGDLDPAIVFKREEEPPFDEEDILMHPAMLLPLSRLRELVQQEWGGDVRLRVTDAYDSLLEHDLGQPDERKKNSLHFEGRAIDLTTWPIDPARYGRLCMLAHCAGFDWVHHEGTHCHAAIKAKSLCARCE